MRPSLNEIRIDMIKKFSSALWREIRQKSGGKCASNKQKKNVEPKKFWSSFSN